jgi:hypothetical protein
MRNTKGWTVTKDGEDLLAGDCLKYKASAKSLVRRLMKLDPDHVYKVTRWPAQEPASPTPHAMPGAACPKCQGRSIDCDACGGAL